MGLGDRLFEDRRRRRALREPPDDAEWARLCERHAALPLGDAARRAGLRETASAFQQAKSLEGAGGLQPTREMALTVSLLAAVPVGDLGLEWYRGWLSVVLYPGGFMSRQIYEDEAGVVHETESPLAGEAWPRGPVILSWEDLEADADGDYRDGSVAIHEFAHKLDLLDGDANGAPPLNGRVDPSAWTEAFAAAYRDFVARVDAGGWLPLHDDAADDPGEFFAVATEGFFTAPRRLRAAYPDLYQRLCEFYGQDPMAP